MYINSVNFNTNNITRNKVKKHNSVSFSGIYYNSEDVLNKQYGIHTDFDGSGTTKTLVSDAFLETTKIFERLLGKSYLPSNLRFKSFIQIFGNDSRHSKCDGIYSPCNDTVMINYDKPHNSDFALLKKAHKKGNDLWPFESFNSSSHPLSSYIHEFAHCAHYKNLARNNKKSFWDEVYRQKISDKAYKYASYGEYSRSDLLEYLAEAMTKNICKKMDREYPLGDGSSYKGDGIIEAIHPEYGRYDNIPTYQVWMGDVNAINQQIVDNERFEERLAAESLLMPPC